MWQPLIGQLRGYRCQHPISYDIIKKYNKKKIMTNKKIKKSMIFALEFFSFSK